MTGWLVGAVGFPRSGGPRSDNFNRPDSSTTINPASDGQSWTVYSGTWGIAGNRGYREGIAGSVEPFISHPDGPGGWRSSRFIGTDVGTSVQTIQIDLVNDNGVAAFGIYPNFDVSTGAAYILDIAGTTAKLRRASSWSASTSLASFSLSAWNGAGGVMGSGITTVKITHDGAGHLQVWQDVGAGFVSKATVTDGTPLSGTGLLLAVNASSSTNALFDNFTAT